MRHLTFLKIKIYPPVIHGNRSHFLQLLGKAVKIDPAPTASKNIWKL